MTDDHRAALITWLSRQTGAAVAITDMALLSGGAIQQNWRLDVTVDGAAQSWVLRCDAAATLAASRGRDQEFALLRAAHAEGVAVPDPLFLCSDLSVLGAPFFVMRRVEGSAAGHRLVRSETLGGGRAVLVSELGRQLARIHRITPPRADLAFLGTPHTDPCQRFVSEMRAALDSDPTPRPVLEWGLSDLERTALAPGEIVLCHNDFRTGNYMVTETALTGILDWEFAAWGDRAEDIGWFCARCWRFGSAYEAGGIGAREDFLAAYAAESGQTVSAEAVAWWERAAAIRWAVIAAAQAQRHISGKDPSLELALTGHIVPELEMDVLRAMPAPPTGSAEADGPTLPHAAMELPDAPDLLEMARVTLLSDIVPALSGDAKFRALMVANAMAIAQRRITDGRGLDALAAAADLRALARAIRGGLDDDGTHALLWRHVRARCAVSAPKALQASR